MLKAQYLCSVLQSDATLLPATHLHLVIGTENCRPVMFPHERLLGFFPKEIEFPKVLIMKVHRDALYIQPFGYLILALLLHFS